MRETVFIDEDTLTSGEMEALADDETGEQG